MSSSSCSLCVASVLAPTGSTAGVAVSAPSRQMAIEGSSATPRLRASCADSEEPCSPPETCTAEHCSANYDSCPDMGLHNEHGLVEATYHDCTCGCCHPEPGSSSDCTDFDFFSFDCVSINHVLYLLESTSRSLQLS